MMTMELSAAHIILKDAASNPDVDPLRSALAAQ
jgi:hypothetical protein